MLANVQQKTIQPIIEATVAKGTLSAALQKYATEAAG